MEDEDIAPTTYIHRADPVGRYVQKVVPVHSAAI